MNEMVTRFWECIRTLAKYDRQVADNDAYYDAGHCGGCETCGNPLHNLEVQNLHSAVNELAALMANDEFVRWMTTFNKSYTTERGIRTSTFGVKHARTEISQKL